MEISALTLKTENTYMLSVHSKYEKFQSATISGHLGSA